MASKPKWQVKHGETIRTFSTLKAAREFAAILNAACGFDFTIISRTAERRPLARIERELFRIMAR